MYARGANVNSIILIILTMYIFFFTDFVLYLRTYVRMYYSKSIPNKNHPLVSILLCNILIFSY